MERNRYRKNAITAGRAFTAMGLLAAIFWALSLVFGGIKTESNTVVPNLAQRSGGAIKGKVVAQMVRMGFDADIGVE